jgi:hypothetical protein
MQYPKIIVALCFAACVSGALAQTKEKTAQYNALGASAARVVRDKGLDDRTVSGLPLRGSSQR